MTLTPALLQVMPSVEFSAESTVCQSAFPSELKLDTWYSLLSRTDFPVETIHRVQKKSVLTRRDSATQSRRTSSHQFGTDFPRNPNQSS
jgi:hypothetical protein